MRRAAATMSPRTLDPNSTELRPLAEYSERLPSSHRGKRLNRATLWRWSLKGLRDGRRLHTVGLGAGRYTCDKWVCDFLTTLHTDAMSSARVRSLSDADRTALRARIAGADTRGAA